MLGSCVCGLHELMPPLTQPRRISHSQIPDGVGALLIAAAAANNMAEMRSLLTLLEPFDQINRLALIDAPLPVSTAPAEVSWFRPAEPVAKALPDTRNALMHAALNASLPMIELLLDAGASVDRACSGGGGVDCQGGRALGTPLMQAIRLGHVELAQLLLRRGASLALAVEPATRETPVLVAIRARRLDMLRTLLAAGADVDACDASGEPPLLAALELQDEAAVLALLDRGCKVTMIGKDGNSPLYWAAKTGQSELAARFLKNGADPNFVSANGETALMIAVRANKVVDTRLLLAAKADPCRRLPPRDEPLLLHAMLKMCDGGLAADEVRAASEIFEMLLAAPGADVNAVDFNMLSPLMIATRVGNASLMHRLIDLGADVSARDRSGATCLHAAALVGSVALCDLLLDAGAQVDATDERGNTALLLAAEFGWVGGRCYDLLDLLLKDKANVRHARAADGQTALHAVVSRGLFDEARLLLRAGADAYAPNGRGVSPLYLAPSEEMRRLFLGMLG